MKTLFLDLKNGISGDMAVAALLNANVMPFEEFYKIMNTLNISGEFDLNYKEAEKFGIFGGDFIVTDKTAVHMHICKKGLNTNEHMRECGHDAAHNEKDETISGQHSHKHNNNGGRTLKDIIEIIESSKISCSAKKLASDIFDNLAVAESLAHNKDKTKIHFHEVGAIDSIIDIVGFSVLFTELNPEMVICTDVNLGSGFVKCQHGVLNVPAPAVLNLCKGFPVYSDIGFEMTTPTGAAIIKTTVKAFSNFYKGKLIGGGIGFGKRDIKIRPNVLNILLLDTEADYENDVIEINTNIDNTTAEDLGYCAKLLLNRGALDVCFSPILMKKFRPGYKLEVLCNLNDLNKLSNIIFENTGTIGLRYNIKKRIVLNREQSIKETKYGKLKAKTVYLNKGKELRLEYDSLEEICDKNGISMKKAKKS